MRIIDWISDVCSSDLAQGAGGSCAAHPYLRPQWHDIPVRRARHCHRRRDREMLQAPSGNRVPRLPQADRRRDPQGARRPPRDGQLCDPQDAKDQGLARTPPALACSLHTDFGVLDQSGRTMVCRTDPQAVAARRSEEHTSELQSLMRISYAVFCLKKKKKQNNCETKSTT